MQPPSWYLRRLRAMSPGEIAARGARQARFAVERVGALRADHPPKPSSWPPASGRPISPPAGIGAEPYVAAADRILDGWFDFFGESFLLGDEVQWNVDPKTRTAAPLTFGKTLNYRDTRVVGDIKVLWELNRHLEVVTLAQAYALSRDRRYLDHMRRLIWTWIRQCPYPLGANWCSSLELGIRLINWQLAYRIAGGASSPLFEGSDGKRFADDWLASIYRHVHFIMGHLSTHSSANNHLIGELTGVYVAAATWPCWLEMDRWRARAQAALLEQVEEQTHDDGVNREQAISYQQFVMYFLLIAGLVSRDTASPFPEAFWQALRRMTQFVDAMLDAGGNLPMIGDADEGIVYALAPRERFEPFRELLAVGGRLFGETHWQQRGSAHEATARWLCADGDRMLTSAGPMPASPRAFPAGGYYIFGERLGEADETRLVMDAGPLGFLSIAAHGHADCLSLLLSVAGKELLIDPGTYCYHTEREWRDYFRGTAAHNTVRIDGIDQSQIAGAFLWAEKAEARVESFETSPTRDRLRARHDGYRRLADPVIHVREVIYDKVARSIDVIDEIQCAGPHRVERFWHFSEDCTVELDGGVVARNDTVELTIEAKDGDLAARVLRGTTAPIGGWISRRFGHKRPTSTVVYANDVHGSTRLHTRMLLRGIVNRAP
jgi:hypothetical protein